MKKRTLFIFACVILGLELKGQQVDSTAPPNIISADPFRGRKWSLYEGGIREPFLARWPGHIPVGVIDSTTVLHATDMFSTFCNLAGVIPPASPLMEKI